MLETDTTTEKSEVDTKVDETLDAIMIEAYADEFEQEAESITEDSSAERQLVVVNLQDVEINNALVEPQQIIADITKPRSLKVIVEMINKRKSQIEQKFIEIGGLLNEAKEIFGKNKNYGKWGKWLGDNFELSQRSAERLMRIAEVFKDSTALSNLGLTKTKADILLRLEDETREKLVTEVDIKELSCRELEKIVRDRKNESNPKKEKATSKGKITAPVDESKAPADLHGKVEFLGDLINSLLDVCTENKDGSKLNDILDTYDELRRLCERTIDRLQETHESLSD
jgi:hypothetical protein